MPDDLRTGSSAAWERARADVLAEWTDATDPATLQPRVPPFNRRLAEFLRENPPDGVEQGRLTRCLEAIEAPIARRDEMRLREVFGATYPGRRAQARSVRQGRGRG